MYYHPKSLTSRGQERADFKTSPCKLQPLMGSEGKLVLVGPHDAQSQPDVFQVRVYSLVMSSIYLLRFILAILGGGLQSILLWVCWERWCWVSILVHVHLSCMRILLNQH